MHNCALQNCRNLVTLVLAGNPHSCSTGWWRLTAVMLVFVVVVTVVVVWIIFKRVVQEHPNIVQYATSQYELGSLIKMNSERNS